MPHPRRRLAETPRGSLAVRDLDSRAPGGSSLPQHIDDGYLDLLRLLQGHRWCLQKDCPDCVCESRCELLRERAYLRWLAMLGCE